MNNKCIYAPLGASNHSLHQRQEDDFYATSPRAIEKLLEVETPNKYIWECACGAGHLSKALLQKGFNVISSDLVNRGFGEDTNLDFLKTSKQFNGDILTNPPYKFAKEFVLKALSLIPNGNKVYMFLKLTFYEGKARKKEIFDIYPPKKIYAFSERIPCAKNGDFDRLKNSGGSAAAYAWFVWEKGFKGDTIAKPI